MENERGNRSKFITCICYNIDNFDEAPIVKTFD